MERTLRGRRVPTAGVPTQSIGTSFSTSLVSGFCFQISSLPQSIGSILLWMLCIAWRCEHSTVRYGAWRAGNASPSSASAAAPSTAMWSRSDTAMVRRSSERM